MTRRQRDVLAYIEDFWRKWGYSPSYRQIADNCGMKFSAAAAYYVKQLAARGFITYTKGKGRSIVPMDSALRGVGVRYNPDATPRQDKL